MTPFTVWCVLTGLAVLAELLTSTFYLLLVAVGLMAGALASWAGASLSSQVLIAACTGGALVLAWHLWRRRHPTEAPAGQNPDVNLDIGCTVQVSHWAPDGRTTVQHRGAAWAAEWRAGPTTSTAAPGPHRIIEVVGNRLVLQAI